MQPTRWLQIERSDGGVGQIAAWLLAAEYRDTGVDTSNQDTLPRPFLWARRSPTVFAATGASQSPELPRVLRF
jgi:hypothetical protein